MTSSQKPAGQDQPADPIGPSWGGLERVRRAVEGINHGEVRVVIQDGVIVQIDRLEKHRLR